MAENHHTKDDKTPLFPKHYKNQTSMRSSDFPVRRQETPSKIFHCNNHISSRTNLKVKLMKTTLMGGCWDHHS